LVLFVTSADRPLTESERLFLERIRDWGKKVIIALNKADLLEDEKALREVREFILQHASEVLGTTPEFFPVSAKIAQRAKGEDSKGESERLRNASGIAALEKFIYDTLDERTRVQLKFMNPLGVAEHIIEQAYATAQSEAEALNEDKDTVGAVESVITQYERELKADLPPRLSEIEVIINRLRDRGLDFFDNTIRLTKIADLSRGDKVRAEFERQVLADVPVQIEQRVQRLIDWLVEKDLHEWQQIMTYLQRRQARYTEHIVGEGVAPLDSRRRTLIDSVGKTASTIVETYDRQKEASELAGHVESAVAQVALLEASAVGLGALVTTLIASSAVDITGLLFAGVIAIVGLFVIPYKRNQAKDNYRAKMEMLRTRLMSALGTQFNAEAEGAVTRMRNGVAPYTRFVRAERERVEQAMTKMEELRRRVGGLKARVQAM
ncbi:MAG: dynamin, partial [Chloroflexi bacterium]|nr:dynamin [Chloroflexota bacterium]